MSRSVDCARCRGTGDWRPGRICYACGGEGRKKVLTQDEKSAARAAHLAELRESLVGETARRARDLAQGRSVRLLDARIGRLAGAIAQLEAA